MKDPCDDRLKEWRLRQGMLGSDDSFGNAGAFLIPGPLNRKLQIISSGSDEVHRWEHVSVTIHISRYAMTPIWMEMCFVKDIFWTPEEIVIQFHPPRSKYINNHPGVLHLWRPLDFEVTLPPIATI